MSHQENTYVSCLKTRSTFINDENPNYAFTQNPDWKQDSPPVKDPFFRNLSVAAALVLCAVTLRTGAIPPLDHTADAILTAATDQSLLDEQLGKLSFVSALFPEAVLVFGEQQLSPALLPVSAEAVTHTWTEVEPYTCWQTSSGQVISATTGEVTGIYHGYGDELIVEVSDESNLTWLYGNLDILSVSLGEQVQAGAPIGTILAGEDFALEVRRQGESIDPQLILVK